MYPFTQGSFAVRNGWYVAAFARDVTRDLLARTILGQPVVLYRKQDGAAVAVGGRCPHRHYPLGESCLKGDSIECGYHGIAFGPDGQCTKVPSQTHVPRSYRIPTYPLVEHGIWMFIWMGDPDRADPALLPGLREIGADGDDLILRIPRDAPLFVAAIRNEAIAVPLARAAGVRTPRLVAFDDRLHLVPDVLQDVDVEDGRIFTLKLRPGHRWSDGAPFTTEDFRYFWEDVANNAELSPSGPPLEMLVDDKPPKVEVIDATTIRYTWDKPNPFFLPALSDFSCPTGFLDAVRAVRQAAAEARARICREQAHLHRDQRHVLWLAEA